MRSIADYLVQKVIAGRDLENPAEKYRVGSIEGWFSITGNLLLALVKMGLGLFIGSIALMADAVHTASDISSSLAVLVGFRLSRKKPDREHPYGHGRIEYMTGLIIALMLIAAGFMFIYTAYLRLQDGFAVEPNLAAFGIVVFSIWFKNMMYHFSMQLGLLIQSEALVADAWHHRSDAYSSAVVLFALVGSHFNVVWLDGVFGILVALFVIYAGLAIARKSISRLLGAAPDPEIIEGVIDCARQVAGVIGAHDLEVHDYGFVKSMTLHIEVDGSLSVANAHKIAQSVEQRVSKTYSCSAVVHLDPGKPKDREINQ